MYNYRDTRFIIINLQPKTVLLLSLKIAMIFVKIQVIGVIIHRVRIGKISGLLNIL